MTSFGWLYLKNNFLKIVLRSCMFRVYLLAVLLYTHLTLWINFDYYRKFTIFVDYKSSLSFLHISVKSVVNPPKHIKKDPPRPIILAENRHLNNTLSGGGLFWALFTENSHKINLQFFLYDQVEELSFWKKYIIF